MKRKSATPREAPRARAAKGVAKKVVLPALLRSMLDAANDLIYAKDLDGRYLACNEASERLLGLREGEQVGRTDFDFFPPEFAEAVRAVDRAVMDAGVERRVEEWVTYPDGTKALLESLKAPFYGPDGKLAGIVGVSRDITARKRTEEQLAKALAFSDQLVAEAPIGIAVYAADSGRCLKANRTVCDIVGATEEQLLSQNFREIDSWKVSGMFATAEATLATGETKHLTLKLTTTFGREIWVLALFSSAWFEEGQRLLILVKDITARKLVEEDRERLIEELTEALQEVRTLSGLLPLCAWCKKIRDDSGCWHQIESYVAKHSKASFSHGMCPECKNTYFPELD